MAIALLVAVATIGLMASLPVSLLQVNPVYQGF